MGMKVMSVLSVGVLLITYPPAGTVIAIDNVVALRPLHQQSPS